jgi:ABC-type uncharacterized transport system auxiliary subunit
MRRKRSSRGRRRRRRRRREDNIYKYHRTSIRGRNIHKYLQSVYWQDSPPIFYVKKVIKKFQRTHSKH